MKLLTPISVHVVDSNHQPMEGAFLTFEESSVTLPELSILTNAAGDARFQLPAGAFRLAARKDGKRGKADFTVNPGSPTAGQQVTIVLEEDKPG